MQSSSIDTIMTTTNAWQHCHKVIITFHHLSLEIWHTVFNPPRKNTVLHQKRLDYDIRFRFWRFRHTTRKFTERCKYRHLFLCIWYVVGLMIIHFLLTDLRVDVIFTTSSALLICLCHKMKQVETLILVWNTFDTDTRRHAGPSFLIIRLISRHWLSTMSSAYQVSSIVHVLYKLWLEMKWDMISAFPLVTLKIAIRYFIKTHTNISDDDHLETCTI